jgi:DivIVA domain-containing protein
VEDLHPDDIVGYRFKQSLRGYAVDEVDQLLDRLADQIERMAAELEELRGRVHVAETQAAVTRETEATLQRTLVVAQQAAERNLADAAAQAEATLANATAEAERIRREVEEDAGRSRAEVEEQTARLRADAEADAARTLERAQEFARREVQAARSRVEEAAGRHAEVIGRVSEHREALRRELANLEELALVVAPTPRAELVAGELPPEPLEHDAGAAGEGVPQPGGDAPHPDAPAPDAPHPGEPEGAASGVPADEPRGATAEDGDDRGAQPPPTPLTIRVHEDHRERPPGESAPLGSGERDDG